MPADHVRRGRPKGSGLDDGDCLKAVVRMLDANPDLKPTTAIKAMGISDPSTIRRVRDKLRKTRGGEADLSRAETELAAPPPLARRGAPARGSRTMQEMQASRPRATALGASASYAQTAVAERKGSEDVAASWLAAWCGVGLHALSTTIEAQLALFENLMSVPPLASALRHQVLLNEQVVAFCSYGTDVRKTLH